MHDFRLYRVALAGMAALLLALPAVAQVDDDLQEIDALIEAREYGQALVLTEALREERPPSEALLYRQALLLYRSGLIDRAAPIANQLVKLNPNQPSYLNLGAAIALRQEEYEPAAKLLYRSLRGQPKDADVWSNLTYALRSQVFGTRTAANLLAKSKQEFPDSLGGEILRAEFHLTHQRTEPFEKLLTEIRERDHPPIPYLRRLALYGRQSGDIRIDLEMSERMLLQAPEDEDLRNRVERLRSRYDKLREMLRHSKADLAVTEAVERTAEKQPEAPTSREMPELPMTPIVYEGDSPAKSPEVQKFRLPFPYGSARYCAQGADGPSSHFKRARFACDFYLPAGSPVLAARSGVVTRVTEVKDQSGVEDYGTWIWIKHPDGTTARYYHIAENTATVNVGQSARRGQVIAAAGRTTTTRYPILHFEVVESAWWNPVNPSIYRRFKTVPLHFEELEELLEEAGAPIAGRWYISRNAPSAR